MVGKYWLGADDGITFTPTGVNLAYTEYAETIPHAMSDHSRTMDQGVFEIVGKGVYQIFGYALVAAAFPAGMHPCPSSRAAVRHPSERTVPRP